MKTHSTPGHRLHAVIAAVTLTVSFAAGACGGSNVPSDTTTTSSSTTTTTTSSSTTTTTGITTGGTGGAGGAGVGGAGGAGGTPDCFNDPMTHLEIINACTDADALDKTPDLPLLGPDGQLPPLP